MTDLMQRHGAHRLFVEYFAQMMVNGENDIRVGDQPLIVAGPLRTSADRLTEVVDPVDMNLGVRRIRNELEADGDSDRFPLLERLTNSIDVTRRPIIDDSGWLNPHRERPLVAIRPSRERRIALAQNLGDVGTLFVTAQTTAHRGAVGLFGVRRVAREERPADAARGALLTCRGERVNHGHFRRACLLHGA